MHASGAKAGGERGHGRGRAFRNHGGNGPGASRNAQWQREPSLALPPLERLTCPQLEGPACPGKGASWTQNKTTKTTMGEGAGSSGRSPHHGRQPSEGKPWEGTGSSGRSPQLRLPFFLSPDQVTEKPRQCSGRVWLQMSRWL